MAYSKGMTNTKNVTTRTTHFWCHECETWTAVGTKGDLSIPYCATCGTVYLCDNCGRDIDPFGNCTDRCGGGATDAIDLAEKEKYKS